MTKFASIETDVLQITQPGGFSNLSEAIAGKMKRGLGQLPAGALVYPPDNTQSISTGAPSLASLRVAPIFIPQAFTLTGLVFEVTAGGAAGSVGRGALYANDATGLLLPGALVADSGTFDTTVIGVKNGLVGGPVTLTPGLFWIGGFFGTASPTVRIINGTNPFWGVLLSNLSAVPGCITAGVAFGAPPAQWPAGAGYTTGATPCVMVCAQFA